MPLVGVKDGIFRPMGLICILLSFGLGIILARSTSWRLWEFDSDIVQFVFIGLWEVCYYQEFNVSGSATKLLVNSPINSTWPISPEFMYAQDLILFSVLLKPVVLIFSAVAHRVIYVKVPFSETLKLCYKSSVFILILCSLCTVVAVSWNHVVDIYGNTTFDFPPTFPVKKGALIKKYHTYVFPTGIVTFTLSLLGVGMFIYEMKSLKLWNQKLRHATVLNYQRASVASSICNICQGTL
ncbi:uncharacterized protein LOC103739252 [Nannospalax galili]|uniref:uncharacterized protein LOC103739252 n=1 Tax=Nannospalax galili TaxID=1026970 RepID=UPI0004ED21D1|nr:uncharacterized protein LOC103739252 [Nannospalax galili]